MEQATSETLIFDRQTREERQFWSEHLSGEFGASGLEPDFPRSGSATELDTLELTLDRLLSQKLAKVTRDTPFLLYTVLLAALKVCLYRQGGGPRVVVLSPARMTPDVEPELINLVAIVDELAPELTFRQVLDGVRQSLTDAYARQHYPFARAVRDAGIAVEQGRCPLSDVVLALEGLHGQAPEMGQDFNIRWRWEDGGLRASVAFKRELYLPETVQRFASRYERTLREALTGAERKIEELDCYGEAERRQMLVEWNQTTTEYPRSLCLHQLFTRQARSAPDRLALSYDGSQLSYSALDTLSNRLAHHLRASGARPGTVVALAMSRSLSLITAMLAVLKTGAAYLPLDPSYPLSRRAFMLEDAGACLLVTDDGGHDMGDDVSHAL
ncbi:MAG: AMP-binding protein, partial [Pyrinomonadaceae bacterium]